MGGGLYATSFTTPKFDARSEVAESRRVCLQQVFYVAGLQPGVSSSESDPGKQR